MDFSPPIFFNFIPKFQISNFKFSMPKNRKRQKRQRTDNLTMLPGAEPGFFTIEGEECPLIKVHSYDANFYADKQFDTTDALFKYLDANAHLQHWIDTDGYGNRPFFDAMSERFGLHPLQIEDVVSHQQRPKVEEFEDHLFIISRMKYTNQQGVFVDEQISLFVFDMVVLSFQDYNEDCLEPVRDRLRKVNTKVRQSDTFFLAYSIQDAIIDNYFPVLEDLTTKLETLEEQALANPKKEMLDDIQEIKRALIDLRKTIWPEKDKINEFIRSRFKQVKPEYEIYLRDTYDHCAQIMDLIESNKEIAHSIMDIYLSSVNNKLSEVMKVLTVISSIFIPLTFIVGVYGMNFAHTDDKGNQMFWNMPELYQPWGYAAVMGVMLLIAIGQILFFKHKKWL